MPGLVPPARQSAYQRLTDWRDTPSSRATSAWDAPRSNNRAPACSNDKDFRQRTLGGSVSEELARKATQPVLIVS